MERIDRKFNITATCVAHNETFTEDEGVFFKAGDAAFDRSVMDAYKRNCIRLGADQRHIEGIDLLTLRIEKFKGVYPERVKVPDVDTGTEAALVNKPNE